MPLAMRFHSPFVSRYTRAFGLNSVDCLSGFVTHGTPNFFREICRKFIHTVLFAAMFRALLQNILFSLAHSPRRHLYSSQRGRNGRFCSRKRILRVSTT